MLHKSSLYGLPKVPKALQMYEPVDMVTVSEIRAEFKDRNGDLKEKAAQNALTWAPNRFQERLKSNFPPLFLLTPESWEIMDLWLVIDKYIFLPL